MTRKLPKGRGGAAARGASQAQEATRLRELILDAFSAKAKRSGIRAVVMGELASELRMSAMTLYKHFASKDELVAAMVDAWALELAAIDALDLGRVDDCNAALERLLTWADAWTASLANVSPAFFKDLHRDHRAVLGALQRADRAAQAGRSAAPRPVPAPGPECERRAADARLPRHARRRSALRGASRRLAPRGGTHSSVDLGRRGAAAAREAARAAAAARPVAAGRDD